MCWVFYSVAKKWLLQESDPSLVVVFLNNYTLGHISSFYYSIRYLLLLGHFSFNFSLFFNHSSYVFRKSHPTKLASSYTSFLHHLIQITNVFFVISSNLSKPLDNSLSFLYYTISLQTRPRRLHVWQWWTVGILHMSEKTRKRKKFRFCCFRVENVCV